MKGIYRVLISLIFVLAGGATLATLLGLAGSLWWRFELLDHPRLQYVLILLIAIGIGLGLRRRWYLIWLCPLAINLALVLPLFFPPLFLPPLFLQWPDLPVLSKAPFQGAATIRLLHANIDHTKSNVDQAIQALDSQAADILLLQEVTPDNLQQLTTQLQHYQLLRAHPQDNSQGSAIFLPVSPRQPLTVKDTQLLHLPERSTRPLLAATLALGDTEFTVLSLHITRPFHPGPSRFQQIEFEAVADWSRQHAQQRLIVIGDFNTTPWSSRFRTLLKHSGLSNSQDGWGWQTTWPANLAWPFQIAIDHCLHSPAIKTQTRTIGPSTGSDHRPLWVELKMA
ncbi:MAG: endonuclease/exonuclease/phosphatase family protein [Cyanobacteria bacterium J06635_1]